MYCPKCNSENKDGAKFCKKCGTSLTKTVHHNINMNKEKDNSKIIIVALIIVAVVLAGALVYMYGFGNNHENDSGSYSSLNSQDVSDIDDDEGDSSQSVSSKEATDSMKIISGSFNTGSELEDKTYANLYVGSEYAGESVTVQIFYSRDGNALNNGNMVPVHVDSSGHIEVSSADAYKYYPDHAKINLYSSSGKLLDTKSVSLSTTSGTQTFN